MSEEIVAALSERYLQLLRSGETPDAAQFCAAYPLYASQLLEILPMLEGLEQLKQAQPQPAAAGLQAFPRQLGEYELLEQIGSGGMGCVFRARQKSLQRDVAIKVLSPLWLESPDLQRKFANESRLVASLHHPNIVQVFGAGREGDFSFYVMELIRGKPLDIEQRRSAREVAELGVQAACALHYAHQNNILHRDIKPANLLLDDKGKLQVSDFGIATTLGQNQSALTRSLDGTLRYMAPERLLGQQNLFASDQYSLGATLYELLSNRAIFAQDSPTAIIKNIELHQIKPLQGVPADLAAIVEKSLSFDAAQRYQDMAQMGADLQRFLDGRAVCARRCGLLKRGFLWSKRRPLTALLCSLVLLLSCGVAASLLLGYRQNRRILAIAENTLQEIFTTYVNQPGTRNTQLLQRLVPYFEELSNSQKISANKVLGAIALRSGQAAIAERAFSVTSERFELAQSLKMQGKQLQAEQLLRELAQGSDLEAVRALHALSGQHRPLPGMEGECEGDAILLRQAWNLLSTLRQQQPEDYRLQYMAALLLATDPHLDRSQSALEILQTLLRQRPHDSICQLLLVRVAAKINTRHPDFDAQIRVALEQADDLLAHHANEPEVLVTVADVRMKHAARLAQSGRMAQAVQQLERSCGLYQILTRHPDAPVQAVQKLQQMEQRLAEFKQKLPN